MVARHTPTPLLEALLGWRKRLVPITAHWPIVQFLASACWVSCPRNVLEVVRVIAESMWAALTEFINDPNVGAHSQCSHPHASMWCVSCWKKLPHIPQWAHCV
jgi:hypothetical protein